MPDVKDKKKHPSGAKAKATIDQVKETSKRHQGGVELINEYQETMHDTELSIAADDYTKACKEHRLWGEKEKATAKALIEEMKRMKLNVLRVGTDKIIKYKFVDAKEVITLKDYKPKAPRRRKF